MMIRFKLFTLLTLLFPIAVSWSQTPTYCSATSTTASWEYIKSVSLNDISNGSGTSKYSDFTSATFVGVIGQQNSISLQAGFSSAVYPENWAVFIDLNKDNDFDDANELVASLRSTTSAATSGTFSIPAGTAYGETRLRIIMNYSTIISACGTFTYGEVEDYTIVIAPNEQNFLYIDSEAGHYIGQGRKELFTLTQGNLSLGIGSLSQPLNALRMGFNLYNNPYFDIEVSAPMGSALIPGLYRNATRYPFNTGTSPGLSASTNGRGCNQVRGEFRLISINRDANNIPKSGAVSFRHYCENNLPLMKGVFFFQYRPLASTINYCAASGTSTAFESIGQVSLGTIANSSTLSSGYENFTHLRALVTPGGNTNLRLTPHFPTGTVYPESWEVFADFNKDGDFSDAGESVFKTIIPVSTFISTSFVIPSTFSGETRVRVRMWYGSQVVNSCGESTYGQVEDYAIATQ